MNKEIELKHQYRLSQKYTALWAFSESVLGRMLHAFKIPFTGLILGGFAVIFLSLISDVSKSKKDVLKVTSIVIVIKFMISPNTPFTAYLAVFMQGFFAFLIFSFIKNRSLAIFILSFFSAIWSASQKILVTTLIFGMTFWYSLDELTLYISKIVGLSLGENFSISLILITIYFLLHLSGAILFARLAIRLPDFLRKNESRLEIIRKNYLIQNDKNFKEENSLPKKKKWFKKPSRIILLFILIIVAFVTYLNPGLSKIKFIDVISMLARAVVLIYVWFKIISPLLVKIFVQLIGKNSDWKFIDEYTSFFPEFKQMILFSWKSNSAKIKMVRIKKFLENALLLLLK